MRLTDKNATRQGTTIGFPLAKACYWKLKDLEDIEEELGIDLLTLFKALKNGCYIKPWAEIKYSYEIRTGSDNINLFLLDENDNDYSLKDYGKTWALTKEELL